MANITKEFLEKALGKEIKSFEVNSGSNIGDGYMSILYTVDVILATADNSNSETTSPKPLHLLIKCFPLQAARQGILIVANIFLQELLVYNTIIPELIKFQKNLKGSPTFIKPPFPQFYYGTAVDYKALPEGVSNICTDPLENCIIMADLRKTGGFKLANRLTGFDLDHAKLVITAQSKLHALSWAYKQLTDIPRLTVKFESLKHSMFDVLDDALMQNVSDQNIDLFVGAINSVEDMEDGTRQELLSSLDRFKGINTDVTTVFFGYRSPKNPALNKDNILRVPHSTVENEEPWLVMTHGDSWLNNMLFRYDENTGKPLEVVLIDLQITREGDPFTDLAYTLYTSTTAELRKQNLNDLLKLYVDTFLQVCDNFKVEPLPGFCLKEVQRRFHRTKAFGFSMALIGLPLFLNKPENVVDFEAMEGTDLGGMVEKFKEMGKSMKGNSAFNERVLGLVTELHAEGVI